MIYYIWHCVCYDNFFYCIHFITRYINLRSVRLFLSRYRLQCITLFVFCCCCWPISPSQCVYYRVLYSKMDDAIVLVFLRESPRMPMATTPVCPSDFILMSAAFDFIQPFLEIESVISNEMIINLNLCKILNIQSSTLCWPVWPVSQASYFCGFSTSDRTIRLHLQPPLWCQVTILI